MVASSHLSNMDKAYAIIVPGHSPGGWKGQTGPSARCGSVLVDAGKIVLLRTLSEKICAKQSGLHARPRNPAPRPEEPRVDEANELGSLSTTHGATGTCEVPGNRKHQNSHLRSGTCALRARHVRDALMHRFEAVGGATSALSRADSCHFWLSEPAKLALFTGAAHSKERAKSSFWWTRW